VSAAVTPEALVPVDPDAMVPTFTG
jgi:hypothetical protein